MLSRLVYLCSAGFVLLNLKGKVAANGPVLSHLEPWRDISNETNSYATCDEKYRYALQKTLDLIWVMKCRMYDAEYAHEQLQAKEGEEIETLSQLFNDMHKCLTRVGKVVARVMMNRNINPWDRVHQLNKTMYNKIAEDWNEIKRLVNRYKPKKAVEEREKITKAVDIALQEMSDRYTPIHDLVVKVQNESYISEEARAKLARYGVPIFALDHGIIARVNLP